MKEKTPNEQVASARQSELLATALEGAALDGTWLNASGKLTPKIYGHGPSVSPFNALTLALHSDAHGYRSNLYTSFADARKRGDSVLKEERGVPFLYYRWDKYVNRHNAEDVISRDDYKALSPEMQKQYKGVRQREVRTLFNLEQTTLPMADKAGYEAAMQKDGAASERGFKGYEDQVARTELNDFIRHMRENLVQMRRDGAGLPRYDVAKDTVFMPFPQAFETAAEYYQETFRQVTSATGHPERLAREGVGNKGEDAARHEALVVELASAMKMVEMGLPARLSPESQKMVPEWARELRENPCYIDAIESDLNNALAMIAKAERGEKVERATKQVNDEAERYKKRPQVSGAEALVLQDIVRQGGMAIDVRQFAGGQEEKKAFMEKFCNLEYYEGQLLYGFDRVEKYSVKEPDPELLPVAWTKVTGEAARIHEKCSEWLPKEWEQKGSYFIADELRRIPDRKTREFAVVENLQTRVVDVILPGTARSGGDVVMQNGDKRNFWLTPDEVMTADERKEQGAQVVWHNLPGLNKPRIQAALKAQGAEYVRFYQTEGALRYRPDDAYFKEKKVYAAKMSGREMAVTSRFDVSDAVRRATETQFSRIQMLKDDNGRWALYLKANGRDAFAVYPDREDINRYFATIKQGEPEQAADLRQAIAQKYYNLGEMNPGLKVDLFYQQQAPEEALKRLDRVQIFRTRDDKILMAATIDGQRQQPREITREQWQRLWVAQSVPDYKNALAVQVFKDKLGLEREAEQKAEQVEEQRASKETAQKAEADKEKTEKEERAREDKQQEDKQSQERREDMRRAVGAAIGVAVLKQYAELKAKHPDAILLFREGDSYRAYKEDAPRVASVIAQELRTAQVDGHDERYAEFPHSELDTWLPKLVREGNRIAICEDANLGRQEGEKEAVVRSR